MKVIDVENPVGKVNTFLLISTLFSSALVAFHTPFEMYAAYFVILWFVPSFISKYGIPSKLLVIFFPLFVTGFLNVYVGNNTVGGFLKVFIGAFSSYLFYFLLTSHFKLNVRLLYRLYIKGAYIVSIIGIFQVLSFIVGFRYGYNFRWVLVKWSAIHGGLLGLRMNSVMPEPSNFAAVIGPAFFISFVYLFFKKVDLITRREAIVILIAYLLTFSSLGYLGIFITLFLLLINYGVVRYFLLIVPLLFVTYNVLYSNVHEFRTRADGMYRAFVKNEYKDGVLHGSSFVLYNHYRVATENFSNNPFFGSGLGSHEIAFDKYSLTNQFGVIDITFNKKDANSMMLRLLSETGLYGALLFIFIVLKFFVSKTKAVDDEDWIISNSLLVVILLYLFRQGNYFVHGFPFYVWLYYLNYKNHQNKLEELSYNEEV